MINVLRVAHALKHRQGLLWNSKRGSPLYALKTWLHELGWQVASDWIWQVQGSFCAIDLTRQNSTRVAQEATQPSWWLEMVHVWGVLKSKSTWQHWHEHWCWQFIEISFFSNAQIFGWCADSKIGASWGCAQPGGFSNPGSQAFPTQLCGTVVNLELGNIVLGFVPIGLVF